MLCGPAETVSTANGAPEAAPALVKPNGFANGQNAYGPHPGDFLSNVRNFKVRTSAQLDHVAGRRGHPKEREERQADRAHTLRYPPITDHRVDASRGRAVCRTYLSSASDLESFKCNESGFELTVPLNLPPLPALASSALRGPSPPCPSRSAFTQQNAVSASFARTLLDSSALTARALVHHPLT